MDIPKSTIEGRTHFGYYGVVTVWVWLVDLLLLFIRAYLKSVAKKLAEDVDNLKTSASTLGKVLRPCKLYFRMMTLYHNYSPDCILSAVIFTIY